MICTHSNLKCIRDVAVLDSDSNHTATTIHCLRAHNWALNAVCFLCLMQLRETSNTNNDAETKKIIQISGKLLSLGVQKPSQRQLIHLCFIASRAPFSIPSSSLLAEHTTPSCMGCPCSQLLAPPTSCKDPLCRSPVPYLLCAVLTD